MNELKRPFCVLIAALGGEGGGVLADWVAAAARASGHLVQSTSIPGVAQRTGATTYYIEIAEGIVRNTRVPLALTPMPGGVDLVVASELVETARAIQNGYVSPDRTTLVASTHRVFTTSEKSHMSDGRFESSGILKAATTLAQRAVMFDMDLATRHSASVISAVMLGAVAGAQVMPIARETFEKVIRDSGIAVESNLKGFSLAYDIASGGKAAPLLNPEDRKRAQGVTGLSTEELIAHAKSRFPVESHYFIEEGIRRLADYQNIAYARLYLDRLEKISPLDATIGSLKGYKLLCETARNLALRMSYEDILRVADLKSRRTRFERVRGEVNAKPGEPMVIVEYFKPGIEEFSSFLPPRMGHRLVSWAERTGRLERYNFGVYLRTSSISGFAVLWLTSKLRFIRPHGYRYSVEQANIESWLKAVAASASISYSFGLEVVECARLIKGYSGTFRRGMANFNAILANVVEPAIAARQDAAVATRAARTAAFADPEADPHRVAKPALEPGFKPITLTRKKPEHESIG